MLRKKNILILTFAFMVLSAGATTAFATGKFGDVPPLDPVMITVSNDTTADEVEYKNDNSIHNQCMEEPDTGSDAVLPTTLVAVWHDDERKFTPEEWTEILEQIERGEVHWAD